MFSLIQGSFKWAYLIIAKHVSSISTCLLKVLEKETCWKTPCLSSNFSQIQLQKQPAVNLSFYNLIIFWLAVWRNIDWTHWTWLITSIYTLLNHCFDCFWGNNMYILIQFWVLCGAINERMNYLEIKTKV